MAEIGEITLRAAMSVKKGEWASLDKLFPKDERLEDFEAKSQVAPDSPIRVIVGKLNELETKAWCYPPAPLTPKSKTALEWIARRGLDTNVMATDDIAEGENLRVVVETA